jgi:uncharacterized protein
VLFSIILIVWTFLHAYVFWRVVTVPVIARHIRRGMLAALAALIWASFPVAHSLEGFSAHAIAPILSVISANWGGVLFLFFVALLAADLVTVFGLLLSAPSSR